MIVPESGNVVQLDDFRPHKTAFVCCEHCHRTWQAVYPVKASQLECPQCGGYIEAP